MLGLVEELSVAAALARSSVQVQVVSGRDHMAGTRYTDTGHIGQCAPLGLMAVRDSSAPGAFGGINLGIYGWIGLSGRPRGRRLADRGTRALLLGSGFSVTLVPGRCALWSRVSSCLACSAGSLLLGSLGRWSGGFGSWYSVCGTVSVSGISAGGGFSVDRVPVSDLVMCRFE